MSSYTMPLHVIIEEATQDIPLLSHKERIEIGRKKLFDFDYPIFREEYKADFETHFIRHFYMREIGFETEELFKFQLETWLHINMPYFNRLFASELLEFDPFTSYDLKTIYDRVNDKLENEKKDSLFNQDTTNKTDSTQSQTNKQIISQTNDKTTDSDVKSTGNKTLDETSSRDQTNVTTETSETDSTTGETKHLFNRDLTSTTPDNRLAITTADGSGVIEYASEIKENLSNGKNDVIVDTSGKRNNTDDITEMVDRESTENITNNDILKATEKDVLTNNTDVNESGVLDSNEKGTNKSNTNDTAKRDANEKENYIETKTGSIGVKTYSAMLIEYRETFIRIERDLFNEMNQLFMMVY